MNDSRFYANVWLAIWGFAFSVVVILSLYLCDGHLIYTLDDPYIHLAVAHNILQGTYGINLGESSSPVSSVLYPLLLAPFVALGIGPIAPLVINTIATGFSVWLLMELVWRYDMDLDGKPTTFGHLLCAILLVATNSFGLPMTGMEHSLHVLAVILVLRGFIATVERKAVPVSLPLAIAVMPFLRFEGAALCLTSLVLLTYLGYRRQAALTMAAIILGFTLWALFMLHLGLPLLPGSVMAKSTLAASANTGELTSLARSLIDNVEMSFNTRWGMVFAVAICGFLFVAHRRSANEKLMGSATPIVAIACLTSLIAHLLAGNYGWFYRYEDYAVVALLTGALYVTRVPLRELSRGTGLSAKLGVLVLLGLVGIPYVTSSWATPMASRNIYEQQFQMHRFATNYFPRPVAVNDLGWVAFANPHYVLDLWGLGSETVRKLRAAHLFNSAIASHLVSTAQVDFVMIYDSWFKNDVPADWCLRAIMQTEQVTAGGQNVMFYAARPAVVDDMDNALDAFEPTLPSRVKMTRVRARCS